MGCRFVRTVGAFIAGATLAAVASIAFLTTASVARADTVIYEFLPNTTFSLAGGTAAISRGTPRHSQCQR
jgi:hypothetical protein